MPPVEYIAPAPAVPYVAPGTHLALCAALAPIVECNALGPAVFTLISPPPRVSKEWPPTMGQEELGSRVGI